MDITKFFEETDALFAAGKYREAEKLMFSGLEKAESENDQGAVLSICNELGGLLRAAARFAEGRRVFAKAVSALEILNLSGTEHEATTMLNYATLLAHSGNPEEALDKYRIAERIYSKTGPANDYRVAALNNNMASAYIKTLDYEKAGECAERALEIIGKIGAYADEIAVTYSLKARISAGLGNYEKALEELDSAEAVYARVENPAPGHRAVTLATYGEILSRLGRYAEAGEYYEKALLLTEQNFGRNLNYAAVLRSFAACKGALGDGDGEKKFIIEADRIEKVSGR